MTYFCPHCGSMSVHYRKTIGDWLCSKCKNTFKRPKKKPYLKINMKVLRRLIKEPPLYSEENDFGRKPISKEMGEYIHIRDRNTCQVCSTRGGNSLKVHHINPRGESTKNNLILICNDCHIFVHSLLRRKGYKYHIPRIISF